MSAMSCTFSSYVMDAHRSVLKEIGDWSCAVLEPRVCTTESQRADTIVDQQPTRHADHASYAHGVLPNLLDWRDTASKNTRNPAFSIGFVVAVRDHRHRGVLDLRIFANGRRHPLQQEAQPTL